MLFVCVRLSCGYFGWVCFGWVWVVGGFVYGLLFWVGLIVLIWGGLRCVLGFGVLCCFVCGWWVLGGVLIRLFDDFAVYGWLTDCFLVVFGYCEDWLCCCLGMGLFVCF